jgi:hypothetical protein
MILFMNMKVGRVFLIDFLKKLYKLVKVLKISVRIQTNNSHQKLWREWSNIALKIQPALAGSYSFRTT